MVAAGQHTEPPWRHTSHPITDLPYCLSPQAAASPKTRSVRAHDCVSLARQVAHTRQEWHRRGMSLGGQYAVFVTPVAGLLLLAVLIMLLRWTFARGCSLVSRRTQPGDCTDYGLLTPVAFPRSQTEADRLVTLLAANNITSTTASTTDGITVMVWPHDVIRALGIISNGFTT